MRLYKHNGPGAEGDEGGASPTAMHALVTRTTLPIRCIALERKPGSGKSPRVAVASDELLVKVVDVADPKRVSLLTGHSKAVRAAAWSPTSPLLVTSSQDGSARVWDLSTTDPACLKVLDGIIPVARPESEFACAACWHPSGRFFVLPSKTHELVIITAPSAGANGPAWVRTGAFTVPSDVSVSAPTGDVSALSFSPNGRYLAVATSDSKVTVWETASRRPIRSEKAETLVTGLSWHPTRDALAWTDTAGQLTRWNNVCGSNHLHPAEAVPEGAPAPARKGRKPDHIDELFRGTGVDEDEDMDGADGGVEGDDLDDFVVDDDGGGYKSGLQEERRRERKGRGPRRAEEMLGKWSDQTLVIDGASNTDSFFCVAYRTTSERDATTGSFPANCDTDAIPTPVLGLQHDRRNHRGRSRSAAERGGRVSRQRRAAQLPLYRSSQIHARSFGCAGSIVWMRYRPRPSE